MAHGFKVYKTKTLCKKNYYRILKHPENGVFKKKKKKKSKTN